MGDDKITEQEIEDYEDELEQEIEDEKADQIEEDNDLREDLIDSQPGVPQQDPSYERFKFLTEVREIPETIRTSYLTHAELGVPLFSVRFWMNLELIAAQKEYKYLKKFLHEKATVTTTSGLSREGFLMNTAITRRRESSRNKTKYSQEVENVKKK